MHRPAEFLFTCRLLLFSRLFSLIFCLAFVLFLDKAKGVFVGSSIVVPPVLNSTKTHTRTHTNGHGEHGEKEGVLSFLRVCHVQSFLFFVFFSLLLLLFLLLHLLRVHSC